MDAAPWQKDACFESLWTVSFYALELIGVANVMYFVSNKPGIDMSASLQEAQSQANTIEESILYVNNVQRMEFVSAWEQDSQVNPDD